MMAFAITGERMPNQLQDDMRNLEMEVIIKKMLAFTIQPTITEAIKSDINPQMEKFKLEVLEKK